VCLHPKHAIKQVDRLLSNTALNVWALFVDWVPHVIARNASWWWRWTGPSV
jgi:hypothetical protein